MLNLWIATAQNHPDGHLRGMDEVDIALEANWEGDPKMLVNALLDCKWLDKNNEGYKLHDWEEHQPWVCHSKERSEMARQAALVRWGKGNEANNMHSACETHAECNAPSPSPSPSPSESPNGDSSAKKKSLPPCPQQKIIDLYHEILPSLTQIRVWDETSKKQLRSRWREGPERQCLEFWEALFEYISKSKFLMGYVKDWSADLSWIVKPSNFAKIINGRYHKESSLTDSQKFTINAVKEFADG